MSNISAFLVMLLVLLGKVPLRVTSGHPLDRRRSTRSWQPEERAYDTLVRPSWSRHFTLALAWKSKIELVNVEVESFGANTISGNK